MTHSKPDRTNELLSIAAQAAVKMPKLETMTLWNGRRGEACSFIYRRRDASITWRGTWDLKLEGSTLDAWSSVDRVEKSLLTGEIRSHGDAVMSLGLHCVVDDISLRQIIAENSRGYLE